MSISYKFYKLSAKKVFFSRTMNTVLPPSLHLRRTSWLSRARRASLTAGPAGLWSPSGAAPAPSSPGTAWQKSHNMSQQSTATLHTVKYMHIHIAHLHRNSHIHMTAPVRGLSVRPTEHRGLNEYLNDGKPIMSKLPRHDNTTGEGVKWCEAPRTNRPTMMWTEASISAVK